jgi:ankyrin repeat protein
MSEHITRLIKEEAEGAPTDEAIMNVSMRIIELKEEEALYTVSFEIFERIIENSKQIPIATISELLSRGLKAYGRKVYMVLPLFNVGNVGIRAAHSLLGLAEDCQIFSQIANSKEAADSVAPKQEKIKRAPIPKETAEPAPQKNKPGKSINEFLLACENGDLETVEKMIEEDESYIRVKNRFGDFPLHKAVWSLNEKLVEFLISKKADVNCKDRKFFTPLHKAVMKRADKIVAMLIENGAEVNTLARGSVSPLFTASINGSASIVKLLISSGADVNVKTRYLDTPLIGAALKGNSEICEILLQSGADKEAKKQPREDCTRSCS